MEKTTALVLTPPNMTAPLDGPNGVLGDRIHQLPTVTAVSRRFARTLVWPNDIQVQQLFQFVPVEFVRATTTTEVIAECRRAGVSQVFCLYADASDCHPARAECALLRQCDEIAAALAHHASVHRPDPGMPHPQSATPLWRLLLRSAFPDDAEPAAAGTAPFLALPAPYRVWADAFIEAQCKSQATLLVSPFSGAPKWALDEPWWRELVEQFSVGQVLVPVYGDGEIQAAQRLFGTAPNVTVFEASIVKTAALATSPVVRVIGNDGGRMNVMAAAHPGAVVTAYGLWPASAWALPNVHAFTRPPDGPPPLTPTAALELVLPSRLH